MKKLALALAMTTVVASSASATIGTGFYLGGSVGMGFTRATTTGTASATTIAGTALAANLNGQNQQIGRDQANIGLFTGYGMVTGCFYFGGEIGYTFERMKIRQVNPAAAVGGYTEFKRTGYFDAAIRAGYLISPSSMIYVRLGGAQSKWKLNQVNAPVAGTIPASKSRFNFKPGVGMETVWGKALVRVEYTYEMGGKMHVASATPAVAYNQEVKSVRSHAVKLGLAYKF